MTLSQFSRSCFVADANLGSASAFVALLALTILAVATPALAAPISVHLEAEHRTSNQLSDVFVCCSSPTQKIVNAVAVAGGLLRAAAPPPSPTWT